MLIGEGTFCANTANIWQVLGWVVVVIKIVIPLALIILGMVDLGKAVVASKDDAISKSVSSLIKRFIAAVVVFFIPTIVNALFNAISLGGLGSEDGKICVNCITDPSNCQLNDVLGNINN